MKKILSIVLCAATASAFAEGEPVVAEIGTVGVTAITTSLSNAIVAVSYDDLADNEGGMVYSNLVKTTNLTKGDKLVEFRDNKYTAWELEKSGDVKYWKELKESYLNASGKQIDLIAPAPDTVRGAVGTGIWLVRRNPIDDENGKTNTFYIYGRPSTSRTVQLVPGKWNLVGNPTTNEVSITNQVDGALNNDQLVLPVAPSGRLCYYTYRIGKGWRTTDSKGDWINDPPKLEAGLGCWIRTQVEASVNW